jgi:transposase
MLYDIGLRRKVLERIKEGMGKREAARLFRISPNTIYEWLKRGDDLTPRLATTRQRKLDKAALEKHVEAHPSALLRERAAHFGVGVNTVWVAMRKLGFVKKTAQVSGEKYYEKNGVSGSSLATHQKIRRTEHRLYGRKRP